MSKELTVTVLLNVPVTHDGKEVSELTFREPDVGALMVADQIVGELSKEMAVLASCCDLPLPVFKQIKSRDLKRILEATSGMLGNESDKPMTGEASSG